MSNAARTSEFFWLCEQCCPSMHVAVEESGTVVVVAGSERHPILRGKPAQPERNVGITPCEASIA